MTANNNKSFIGYLNNLVDEYHITYHLSIGEKPIDADYSALTNEIEPCHKFTKFKVGNRVRITKYKIVFSKGYTKKLVKGDIC